MTTRIVPLLPRHVRGFHAALDGIAREGRFLAMTEAPPLAAARRFIRNGVAAGSLQFVALIDDTVVGWCDISRLPHAAQRHSGTLGMGVVAAQRGSRNRPRTTGCDARARRRDRSHAGRAARAERQRAGDPAL
jgi:hypothetical protein